MSPRRPRLAVVGPFPPFKGGISQHTARLADALEVHADVRRISWAAQYPNALYRRDQRDSNAPTTRDVEWTLRWWDPTSWARVGRSLRDLDAYIVPWVSPAHAPAYEAFRRLAPATAAVAHVHNVTPHEPMPFATAAARRVLGRMDVTVCHGAAIATDLVDIGVAAAPVVTPHPPDLDISPTPLRPRPPIRLLFAGTIRNYKGLDTLVEALAILRRTDVALTIAGEVWSDSDLPSSGALDALDVEVITHFGYVSDDGLCELLRDCHLLVAPYRAATQSGIVSLALAAGRGVVVTPVGALTEAVDDGRNGVVADRADDPEALAIAIDRAIGSVDALAEAAAAAPTGWDEYAQLVLAQLS